MGMTVLDVIMCQENHFMVGVLTLTIWKSLQRIVVNADRVLKIQLVIIIIITQFLTRHMSVKVWRNRRRGRHVSYGYDVV